MRPCTSVSSRPVDTCLRQRYQFVTFGGVRGMFSTPRSYASRPSGRRALSPLRATRTHHDRDGGPTSGRCGVLGVKPNGSFPLAGSVSDPNPTANLAGVGR